MIRYGLLLGMALALAPGMASAAGITVSPAFQSVTLSPEMVGKDIVITLTNQSQVGQTYALSTADFGTLDESGGVALIGTPATELEHRYGLVSWMTLDRNVVFVPPAGSAKVTVRIDNRPSLSPGGHYAAVLATAVADPINAAGPAKVNLKQVVASLILLRKDGGAEPGLTLTDIDPRPSVWWQLPSEVALRFRDPGNVHVVPRGTITLTDMTGRVVKRGIINEDSAIVYPQSFRRMTSKLLTVGNAWQPGRYQLSVVYRFDDERTLSSSKITIWYLGTALTWLVFGIIMALLAGLWLLGRRRQFSIKKWLIKAKK